MILEEETFEVYGYYPGELKPQSAKKILATCDECGKVRITSKNSYCSLCLSCAHKGKRPSEGAKQKMSEAHKGQISGNAGKHHSEEAKRKISEGHKGQIPWNKGKTGVYSEETRRKIGEASARREITEETRKKMSEANKGKNVSEETRKKISEATKGRIPWNKGKHLSDEHKRRIGDAKKGQVPWNKGKTGVYSEETKRKMRENLPDRSGKNNSMFGRTGESAPMFGKHHSEETKQKNREARKLIKFPKHHTKPERIWQEIVIDKHSLPFRYTGDGSFWIGGKPAINPDFIHLTKKIVVEIFSYWHDPLQRRKIPYSQTYEGRKKILKKYGWKLIVFWDTDLLREDAEAFVLSVLRKNKII